MWACTIPIFGNAESHHDLTCVVGISIWLHALCTWSGTYRWHSGGRLPPTAAHTCRTVSNYVVTHFVVLTEFPAVITTGPFWAFWWWRGGRREISNFNYVNTVHTHTYMQQHTCKTHAYCDRGAQRGWHTTMSHSLDTQLMTKQSLGIELWNPTGVASNFQCATWDTVQMVSSKVS